jgi:hypothetical protein
MVTCQYCGEEVDTDGAYGDAVQCDACGTFTETYGEDG